MTAVEPWHGQAVTTEMDSHSYEAGRFAAFAEVQEMLAKLIIGAEDSYAVNKGSAAGLVAFGQKIALRGASERAAWMAASRRTA